MAGLYLHVPFCRRKCNYCDFFSAPPRGDQLSNWHLLLARNISLLSADDSSPLDTIFFGGGTPSLLSPQQVVTVLESAQKHFGFSADVEISLEANPADLSWEQLAGYHRAGVNRLSLGVQSFSEQQLKRLGRRHSAEQARQAVQVAREVGFNNLSLDLMFALPGQTRNNLQQEIVQLVEVNPDHVGIYGLSIEPGTPLAQQLAKQQIEEVGEESYAQFYLQLSEQLVAAGFEHYEISNFARPGARCRHNLAYWQRKTCFAAGAGAHGFDARGFGTRTAIPADLPTFQEEIAAGRNPAKTLEVFDRQQAMAETMYLGLRTSQGVDGNDFTSRFGVSPAQAYPDALEKLSPHLVEQKNSWRMSVKSWLLYDHLISYFL